MLPFLLAASAAAQPAITTAQYDNYRTGANLHETLLTPRNVNSAHFGKLFAMPVDGDVFAQPLYVPRLEIPGKGLHDVVFLATERDSVYAFDAATPSVPLWHVSFLRPAAGVNAVSWSAVHCSFIGPDIGITPTPVIDLSSRTIYVIVRTMERSPEGQDLFFQRLHALDLGNGAEKPGSPVVIRASVTGSAFFGLIGREVRFNAALENPRAALLLSNGTVYIAWGSSCDVGSYYGWVLAYDARTLKQTGVFNTAPDAGESGIWQSDAGLAADAEGNVYGVTGNGKFTASSAGGRDFGDSVLKLGLQNGTLAVRDYFTPFNESSLNRKDDDFGSCGPVLLPDQPGPHPHLMVAAGKAGVLYLIDRDRMGKFHAGSDSHALQTLNVASAPIYGAPAYGNGHLYLFATDDVLKDYPIAGDRLAPAPAHRGSYKFKNPGAIPVLSANGSKDGMVWVVLTKGYWEKTVSANLQAYDAEDVSRLLYTTEHDPHNSPGTAVRFTMPTVANGRVYVGSRDAVYVYGLLDSKEAKH
jgi:outer membrane protein assembly factor BamB